MQLFMGLVDIFLRRGLLREAPLAFWGEAIVEFGLRDRREAKSGQVSS